MRLPRQAELRIACGLTILAGVISCGSSSGPGTGTEARSPLARITTPVVSADDTLALAAGNRAFAVDLHQALRSRPGNLVYAPASISVALAMLYGGASGATASEIAQTLHFTLPPERLHLAFDALDLALSAPPADATAFRLSIANAAWGQRGYQFLPAYLDLLAQDYGSAMRLVDFGAPETARAQINQWVADNTQQKILDLIPTGALYPDTRLVLTNAVYFKADWQMPFAPQSADGIFHAPTGDVTAKMMRGPEAIWLWGGAGYSAAALPYAGETTSMILIVPDAGTFDAFEQGLTGDSLGAILAGQSAATLGGLAMPRFKFETKTDLVETLDALGMKQAFVPSVADLSGIDGTHDLYVSDVIHQATIAVDEKGTEAAAATAVIIGRASAVLSSLTVDRPFLCLIRNDATGASLFQGRVLDPTK
jgi:serpin B